MKSSIIIICLSINNAFACLKKSEVTPKENLADMPYEDIYRDSSPLTKEKSKSNPISGSIGRMQTVEYNPIEYSMNAGGPVHESDKLCCDFNGPCCWANVPFPVDQLDWKLVTGMTKENNNFASEKPLSIGNYLKLSSNGAAADEGQFVSCTIKCAQGPIEVTVRHWQTESTMLDVCTKAASLDHNNSHVLSCVRIKKNDFPGYATVQLPQGKLIDIVFIGKNLNGPHDSIIIDEIEVNYEPCD